MFNDLLRMLILKPQLFVSTRGPKQAWEWCCLSLFKMVNLDEKLCCNILCIEIISIT